MKRLMLSVAFICALFVGTVSANETKTISENETALVLSQETVDYINNALDTAVVYNNPAKLYGVYKIKIFNPAKDSVLILDEQGRIVKKTNDSIEITVPEGNYWILSSGSKVRTEFHQY